MGGDIKRSSQSNTSNRRVYPLRADDHATTLNNCTDGTSLSLPTFFAFSFSFPCLLPFSHRYLTSCGTAAIQPHQGRVVAWIDFLHLFIPIGEQVEVFIQPEAFLAIWCNIHINVTLEQAKLHSPQTCIYFFIAMHTRIFKILSCFLDCITESYVILRQSGAANLCDFFQSKLCRVSSAELEDQKWW